MCSDINNVSRGGAREGAGRKPIGGDRREPLSVRVKPLTRKLVQLVSQQQGKSMGTVVDEAIAQTFGVEKMPD